MPCYPTLTQCRPRVWTGPHLLEWYRLDPFCFPHIKHIDGVLTEHCQVGSCVTCRVENHLCCAALGQARPSPGLLPPQYHGEHPAPRHSTETSPPTEGPSPEDSPGRPT